MSYPINLLQLNTYNGQKIHSKAILMDHPFQRIQAVFFCPCSFDLPSHTSTVILSTTQFPGIPSFHKSLLLTPLFIKKYKKEEERERVRGIVSFDNGYKWLKGLHVVFFSFYSFFQVIWIALLSSATLLRPPIHFCRGHWNC